MARRRRDRRPRRGSTATPTGTPRSTRSRARCSAPAASAISAPPTRPTSAPAAGSRAASCFAGRRGDSQTRAGGPSSVDVTIRAGRPHLGEHLPAMRSAIAGSSALGTDAVSVKASTGNLAGDVGAAGDRGACGRDGAPDSGARRDAPPARHADRRDAAARAARARPRRDLQLRPDRLRPDAHRQLPVVPVRRRPRPLPALPRAARHLGHEHHRRRRSDHRQGERGRTVDRRADRRAGSSSSPPISGAAR